MPKSEHIHSGYQYSFSHSVACNPKVARALKRFPSDNQIDELLKLAQKQANTLIQFTGMQKVPGVEGGSVTSPVTGDHHAGVSISITKQYCYKSQPSNIEDQSIDDLEDVISEAAMISGDRCTLDHELILDEETHTSLETETTQSSRMSIQTLLNPQGKLIGTP
ncbi:hypothetical protein PGTUg99_012381 [Puccinia graminis f. sp. tritici]|uniref:Uncharacterized protein n=1 Tax=Puccinia graminis f. sp. tritici TaxID=56615 RepID=A0A5B0Q0Z7_PUCGR|nr:hypothetical protein PGTUg99_012381 [Puccinia graminis f. sp. tritici]